MSETQHPSPLSPAPPRQPQLQVWFLHIVEQPHRTRLRQELRELGNWARITALMVLRLIELQQQGDARAIQEKVNRAFGEARDARREAERAMAQILDEEADLFGTERRRPGDWPESLGRMQGPENPWRMREPEAVEDPGWAAWPAETPPEEEGGHFRLLSIDWPTRIRAPQSLEFLLRDSTPPPSKAANITAAAIRDKAEARQKQEERGTLRSDSEAGGELALLAVSRSASVEVLAVPVSADTSYITSTSDNSEPEITDLRDLPGTPDNAESELADTWPFQQ
ncbi:hypothetical protein QBC37DRAFT_401437 [Rhypophila decipiens]|uniref:Uncharacterized protein n=1 Tax=Rhypophila decipiens TaxID=261697 RepID=A0AAN6Y761_9PEZI|nr:hypothetical protein QBC37DRAFT_401437 [Rhypophila decipiens]